MSCKGLHFWDHATNLCVDCGISKLQDMLQSRQGPFLVTDDLFRHGHTNGSQFEKTPQLGDHYKKVAEAAGQNVKGKIYKGSLAEYPGDPRAWVESRGDVERLCRERGWDCEGIVNVNGYDNDHAPLEPKDDLADDIVDDIVYDQLEGQTLSGKEVKAVREKVKAKHKPNWKKK